MRAAMHLLECPRPPKAALAMPQLGDKSIGSALMGTR